MTDAEFATFRQRLFATFPALAEWGRNLDGVEVVTDPATGQRSTVPHRTIRTVRNAIKQRWANVMRSVDLKDALDALDVLGAKAVDPWPYPADKERAAAIVAEAASAKRRAAAAYHDDPDARKGRYQPTGAYSIMGRIIRAIETDERHDEECQQHRALRRRCRLGCEVPRMVADEMLASEDAGEF